MLMGEGGLTDPHHFCYNHYVGVQIKIYIIYKIIYRDTEGNVPKEHSIEIL
jgi:hypothetical protein